MSALNLFESTWADVWGDVADYESVGAVFTKPAIVDLILDLAGYQPARCRLANFRLLEPSCGDGAFLRCVVQRLVASERIHTSEIDWGDKLLDSSVRAADISIRSVELARDAVVDELVAAGCSKQRATKLAATWVVHTDFLLAEWATRFDFVVGNPPYVRVEGVPRPVLARYRALFATATDRADLYVAFIEHGLSLLSDCGVLAYICANRFTKNHYGAPLRRLIASQFRVKWYLNLEHTQPFEMNVSAYPGIFVVDRQRGGATLSATLFDLDLSTLEVIREVDVAGASGSQAVSEFNSWYEKGEIWATTSAQEAAFLAGLERTLPLLEDSAPGTKVGIGVATGADQVFVLPSWSEAIEATRQLPLIMAGDISNEGTQWSGHYVVNPFEDDGSLVDLRRYPGLAARFSEFKQQLAGRHVAKKRADGWYRTIDRIWPALMTTPKLLIPDIRGVATIGVDDGQYYPHHNVYWITSDGWMLDALKALLRSTVVLRQVRAFSVAMRGGHLRFQAQTLRRLRVPHRRSLTPADLHALARVACAPRQEDVDVVVNQILVRIGVALQ